MLAEHVVDTGLTTLGQRAEVLGANGTEEGADENDGGLHLVGLLGWERLLVLRVLRFKNVNAQQ